VIESAAIKSEVIGDLQEPKGDTVIAELVESVKTLLVSSRCSQGFD
jgi:hypothetical protein